MVPKGEGQQVDRGPDLEREIQQEVEEILEKYTKRFLPREDEGKLSWESKKRKLKKLLRLRGFWGRGVPESPIIGKEN